MLRFILEKDNQNYIPPNCTSIQLADDSKLSFLCNFLQGNTTVKEIYLQDLPIGVEGAKEIAKVLKVNRTITELDLSNADIGDEGAKVIAEALKVNRTITTLILDFNQIGDEGAKAIAEALKVNRAVEMVFLWDNRIGNEGAKAIADALKVNDTVIDIKLLDNQIRDEGAEEIIKALKVNCTVKFLNLDRNAIGRENLEAIARELSINMLIILALRQTTVRKFKTMALGLFEKVPIYVLLDVFELVVILDLERQINSRKFYNNHLFLKLFENKVSKRYLLRTIDKMNRQLFRVGQNDFNKK